VYDNKEFLLVDDDPDDQEIFQIALDEIDPGIKLVVANNGIEALQLLKKDPSYIPDFIFLDINMPKMNGIQCLPEIRKFGHLENVPIIMYSTSSDINIINNTKKLGATEFLVKPTGLRSLVKNLEGFLKR
jgi:CheY-like chemotaxis protein